MDDKDDWFKENASKSSYAVGAGILTGRKDLLNQSVREIQTALSGNGKLKINRKIRRKVRSLTEDFGLEGDEIENVAIKEFLSRKLYEKCKPEKPLSTFCTYFASYSLNGQLRTEKHRRKHYKAISLDGLAQDTHDNDWAYTDEFLEPAENESLADHLTPEDFLHAKELLELIIKHFGYDDAAVALGCKSRRAEAKRLGITLDAYCKRLQRKTDSFKIVLKDAGYHDIRHSVARYLNDIQKVGLKKVQQVLRHRRQSTTEIYVDGNYTDTEAAVRLLELQNLKNL